jgi:hypothetical protein
MEKTGRRSSRSQRAAEEKLAATNMTADGQLNLSGIDNEHKRLFLMIYNGNFHDLSEREDVRDLPIMIYRGMIIQNDKLCHDFLSRNAVTVVETWDRLDDISRGLFGTVTKTYVRRNLLLLWNLTTETPLSSPAMNMPQDSLGSLCRRCLRTPKIRRRTNVGGRMPLYWNIGRELQRPELPSRYCYLGNPAEAQVQFGSWTI